MAANDDSFGFGVYKSLDQGIGFLLSEEFKKITPPLRKHLGSDEYIKLYRQLLGNPDIFKVESNVQKKIINNISKTIIPKAENKFNELVVYALSVASEYKFSSNTKSY